MHRQEDEAKDIGAEEVEDAAMGITPNHNPVFDVCARLERAPAAAHTTVICIDLVKHLHGFGVHSNDDVHCCSARHGEEECMCIAILTGRIVLITHFSGDGKGCAICKPACCKLWDDISKKPVNVVGIVFGTHGCAGMMLLESCKGCCV